MKTTVDISAPLLHQARRLAAREGVTLCALIERGLHRVVSDAKQGRPFKLSRASFKGEGLQSRTRAVDWETLRDLAYKDRGTASPKESLLGARHSSGALLLASWAASPWHAIHMSMSATGVARSQP